MLLFRRSLRRVVFGLLCMVPGVCAGQGSQFFGVPEVEPTGGRVASFLAGTFQNPPGRTDLLYISAPVGSGATSSIMVGELLNQQGRGFAILPENQILFTGVSNVVAAEGSFLGTGSAYAFALTSSAGGAAKLCLYGGTGASVASQSSSYSGGNVYPPTSGSSGCMTLQLVGSAPPQIEYMAAFPFRVGQSMGLIVEDTANNYLYVLSFSGAAASNGVLGGVVAVSAIPLAPAEGTGPIYVGDFNGDGSMDFVVNGQTGYSATVYLGNGNGTFQAQPGRYVFDAGVRSMLMQDMDGDKVADMVVENNSGAIEIHHGNGDGTFAAAIEGGTVGAGSALAGYGGHLAAINPNTLDILTATPIGLSLLRNQGGLSYGLKSIYNIGPGRSSFALVDFYGTGNLDLAVDSAEGVAILTGNPDGTFVASNAYAALAPGLGAVVGQFRNAANNPNGNVDVVVGTGATQAQLLAGNGDGTFTTFAAPVDLAAGPTYVPATAWSNILSGDFDGDGNLDVLYSLTGLPSPGPSGSNFPILYIQYGNGDGTFGSSGFTWNLGAVGVNSNTLYSESAVGDFNGDGVSDIGSGDAEIEGTLLGVKGTHGLNAGLVYADVGIPDFDQVAAGFFKENRSSQQDLVFHQGASFIPYVNAHDGTGKNFTQEPGLVGASAPLYLSALLLTDVDGDGNGDVVALYYNSAANAVGAGPVASAQLYIWYGNGDGTFGAAQVMSLSRNYYLGAAKDMNGDGLPDLVLSDGSLVSILYNQGGGGSPANRTFGGEQHFLAGQGINSITLADVNGDGAPDLIVANGGATISNAIALGGNTASSISLATNQDVNTGGITVLLNAINTKPVTHNITGGTTTTTLYLCPGPTVNCPATGSVMPPFASAFSMYYGQDWNGTVVVTASDGGALPGSISIYDAYSGAAAPPPAPLCTLPTTGGACAASVGTTVGTSVGTNVITAVYTPGPGDTHTGSTSSPVAITVLPDITSAATLIGAPNPSPQGQPVTLTATLTGSYAAPTGPVTFAELFPSTALAVQLGTANLVPGTGLTSTATFITTTLPLGTDTISASYAATQNFAASSFPVITETITPGIGGSFALTVTPASVSVGVGYATLLTVTATGQNGFAQGVNLTCSNLPSEAACVFDTASLPAGGGTTNLVVSTTAPHSCGTTQPYFLGGNGGAPGVAPFALPAVAGLLAMFLPGRRRWLRALIALIVVAGVTQMTGCGTCTDLGTRPATYSFQVTGTSTVTGEVQSQSVTITVTI